MTYEYWKLGKPDIWSWEHYINGFRTAADNLAALTENDRRAGNLVYPTMFFYRHYLELRIKQLILGFQELMELPAKIPMDHRLLVLWKKVRELEQRAILSGDWNSEENFDKYPEIEEQIREFDKMDQGSDEFRYPVDKNGAPTLRRQKEDARKKAGTNIEVPPDFNLSRVRDKIKETTLALDGAIDMIDEFINLKAGIHQDTM